MARAVYGTRESSAVGYHNTGVAKKSLPRGPQLELADDLSVAFVNTAGAPHEAGTTRANLAVGSVDLGCRISTSRGGVAVCPCHPTGATAEAIHQGEVHRRLEGDRWLLDLLREPEARLRLPNIGFDQPLSLLYANVNFPADD